MTSHAPQTAVKEWERHPPFVENVVTTRPNPMRVAEPSEKHRSVDLPLHELVVPVCCWAGKWMDWTDNEVVFGWSTARWHNHIPEADGGCLLIPRSGWGPTDPEFVRCPRSGCVTHHDWNWIDAVADIAPAALKEHGLNALVCDWINTGNRAANRIRDDHALFMAV